MNDIAAHDLAKRSLESHGEQQCKDYGNDDKAKHSVRVPNSLPCIMLAAKTLRQLV